MGKPAGRVKLALSTYSYWHFRDPKVSIETVIDKAAQFGVEGVDVLHRQMDAEDKPLSPEVRRIQDRGGILPNDALRADRHPDPLH